MAILTVVYYHINQKYSIINVLMLEQTIFIIMIILIVINLQRDLINLTQHLLIIIFVVTR